MSESSERYRRLGWWREETFLDDLRRHTRDHPGRTAVITRRVTGECTGRTFDYAELGVGLGADEAPAVDGVGQ